jgi:electron transport complex protein RnfD
MSANTAINLKITSSPHIRTTETVPRIMWAVNAVLAPVGLFAIYWFGWRALLTMFLCIGSAVVTEFWVQRLRKVQITCWDGSAVLTGLLFAYVMPANQPWYVSVIGSAFAIGIAKHAFGGLGNNIWNPALVARAFVLAAWPAMTILGASWPLPGPDATPGIYDLNDYRYAEAPATVTAPSPLTDPEVQLTAEEMELPDDERTAIIRERWQLRIDEGLRLSTGLPKDLPEGETSNAKAYLRLFLGARNGCLGETAGLLLILGGIFLLVRGYLNWRVPVFFILSALVVAFILPEKIRLGDGTTAWTAWFAGDMLRQLLGGWVVSGNFRAEAPAASFLTRIAHADRLPPECRPRSGNALD